MYIGLRTSDALHKTICCMGLGLCGTSENSLKANFAEFQFYELR